MFELQKIVLEISIPGYITKMLLKFKHLKPSMQQDADTWLLPINMGKPHNIH